VLWTGEDDVCKLRKENKKMKKDLGKLKQELSGLDHVSASLVVIIPPTNEIRGVILKSADGWSSNWFVSEMLYFSFFTVFKSSK